MANADAPARSKRIGIELGRSVVRVAEVGRAGDGYVIVRTAQLPRPSEPAALGAALRDALRKGGFTAKDAAWLYTDAPEEAHPLLLDLPKLSATERRVVIEREMARVLGAAAEDHAIADAQIAPPKDGRLSRVLAVALPHSRVEQAISFARAAGLRPRALLTGPDAVRGLKALARAVPAEETVALVQHDGRAGVMGIFRGESLLFFREFGSRDGADDAGGGAVPDVTVVGETTLVMPPADEASDEAAERLAGEIDRSLTYFAQQHRPMRAEKVFVAGPSELTVRVCEQVGRCEPMWNIGGPKDAGVHGLAVAVAAALDLPCANLVPAAVRSAREVGFVLAAGVVLCALAVAFALSRESELHRRIERAQEQVAATQAEYAKLDQVREAKEAMNRVKEAQAMWRGVLGRMERYRDRWTEFPLALAAAAPPGVFYQRLEATRQADGYEVLLVSTVRAENNRRAGQYVSEVKQGLGRLKAIPSLHAMPADSQPLKSGVEVEQKFTFRLLATSPLGGE